MNRESRFWRAVTQRDARFDGQFVYAVQTTGVYCRPSCPSRRPLRESVQFFAEPGAAERRGFRACLRCGGRREESARQMAAYIDKHLEDETRITLAALAKVFGKSPFHLQRVFKRAIGVSPREYAEARRLGQWKKHLRGGRDIAGATYEAGYGSSSRLYERASARLGMTPAVYGRGGEGMHIDYVIADAPPDSKLGRVLVGFTERGVSAVYLGVAAKSLEAELRREYPRAEIRRAANNAWARAIVEYLRGRHTQLDLPLDLAATAFQMQVWRELQRIPRGTTQTYTQVARSIGKPAAVRAVARACAGNPVSVVVPCHRVVRADGNLAGYRWGLRRKEALLSQEKTRN